MFQERSQKSTLILYLLSISSFFVSLNQNIYTPVIPLIRDSFDVSINWVNFTVSSFIFIIALIQIILGTVIDHKNKKRLLILSFVLMSVSAIVCAFATNFTLFMIFRMAQAVGAGIIPLVAINMISHLFEGERRGNAMGTYQILLTLAPAAAPVLGGVLGEYFGYQGIFIFLFLGSIALLLGMIFGLPDVGKREVVQKQSIGIGKTYRSIFSNRLGVMTMLVSFFIFLIYFAILVYMPTLLSDHYHVALQNIGLLYLPLTVSMILGSVLFKKLQAKITLRKLFMVILFFMPVLIVIFGFVHLHTIVGLSILLFLYGMTVGFAPPLFSTMISEIYDEERGAALGIFNFIRYFGMAVGGMFTGLFQFLPSSVIFIILGLILLIISLTQYVGLKGQRIS